MLRSALAHLYGEAVASLYSFHSFRSGLATALHAAGVSDAMIQLICRWMCPESESLHVYRRMGVAGRAPPPAGGYGGERPPQGGGTGTTGVICAHSAEIHRRIGNSVLVARCSQTRASRRAPSYVA